MLVCTVSRCVLNSLKIYTVCNYCTALQVNASVNKEESRVVAGKPHYAAVNSDRYGVCRQMLRLIFLVTHGRA